MSDTTLLQPALRVCIVDDDPTALAATATALGTQFDVAVARLALPRFNNDMTSSIDWTRL